MIDGSTGRWIASYVIVRIYDEIENNALTGHNGPRMVTRDITTRMAGRIIMRHRCCAGNHS